MVGVNVCSSAYVRKKPREGQFTCHCLSNEEKLFLYENFFHKNKIDKGTIDQEDSQTSEGQIEEDCVCNNA